MGTLDALTADGRPMVVVADHPAGCPVEARACVSLGAEDVGSEVVLLFADGSGSPIVLGVIRPTSDANRVQVTADGKSVTVTAQESITLQCGEARITLHRTGKVVIRGTHLVSQSSGANSIRGGSVQLN